MIDDRKRAVLKLSADGILLKRYETLDEASRITGINAAHICDVCKGKRNLAGGYLWKYASDV